MSFAVDSGQMPTLVASHSRAAFCSDRVEHRLQIDRRAADDLEHVAGRGLVFERFVQFALARLLRLEQPRVLDGDDGLVGEGLDQLDLLVA